MLPPDLLRRIRNDLPMAVTIAALGRDSPPRRPVRLPLPPLRRNGRGGEPPQQPRPLLRLRDEPQQHRPADAARLRLRHRRRDPRRLARTPPIPPAENPGAAAGKVAAGQPVTPACSRIRDNSGIEPSPRRESLHREFGNNCDHNSVRHTCPATMASGVRSVRLPSTPGRGPPRPTWRCGRRARGSSPRSRRQSRTGRHSRSGCATSRCRPSTRSWSCWFASRGGTSRVCQARPRPRSDRRHRWGNSTNRPSGLTSGSARLKMFG